MLSFHLYISFHLTLWVACLPLESPLAYVFIQSSDCKSYINKDNKASHSGGGRMQTGISEPPIVGEGACREV